MIHLSTRKQKLEFIKNLNLGKASIHDLNTPKAYCFIQELGNSNLYSADDGSIWSTEQIEELKQRSSPTDTFIHVVDFKDYSNGETIQ
ncbi:MAG TPA: hypothetical protein VD794_07775 [Flavisolibacter sp.]|nr:hypothetical protein [Flavisolibacter sp.]